MNMPYKSVLLFIAGSLIAGNSFAGELSADQIAINANILKRDSGNNITYLYNNNGTVNNTSDDIALAGTGSFNANDDTGYQLSGSKKINNHWSVYASGLSSELSKTDAFTDPSNRLEIFPQYTSNFDSAYSVKASYSSKLQNLEVNAVYRLRNNLDVFAGLNQLKLDEQFKMVSDDTGSSALGVGTYTINTSNKMLGPQVGLAYDHRLGNSLSLYAIGKAAWLRNEASQNQVVDDNNGQYFSRSNAGSHTKSSVYYNLILGLKYHFTRKFVLDAAYQYIHVSDVALAANQFDTSLSGSNAVKYNDSISWSGVTLGVGYYF